MDGTEVLLSYWLAHAALRPFSLNHRQMLFRLPHLQLWWQQLSSHASDGIHFEPHFFLCVSLRFLVAVLLQLFRCWFRPFLQFFVPLPFRFLVTSHGFDIIIIIMIIIIIIHMMMMMMMMMKKRILLCI